MTPHKQKKAVDRRKKLRQHRTTALKTNNEAKIVSRRLVRGSDGLKKPSIHVEIDAFGTQRIIRYGLDPLADIVCPHCEEFGEENTLYLDAIQEGFKNEKHLVGHCAGCHARNGTGVRNAVHWGIKAEHLAGDFNFEVAENG